MFTHLVNCFNGTGQEDSSYLYIVKKNEISGEAGMVLYRSVSYIDCDCVIVCKLMFLLSGFKQLVEDVPCVLDEAIEGMKIDEL
uniref:Uncharacterized protein n=1 Tax=Strongyloides venezuelensis TaxID=75913 RepID=A0A0K0G2U7_STRVS